MITEQSIKKKEDLLSKKRSANCDRAMSTVSAMSSFITMSASTISTFSTMSSSSTMAVRCRQCEWPAFAATEVDRELKTGIRLHCRLHVGCVQANGRTLWHTQQWCSAVVLSSGAHGSGAYGSGAHWQWYSLSTTQCSSVVLSNALTVASAHSWPTAHS